MAKKPQVKITDKAEILKALAIEFSRATALIDAHQQKFWQEWIAQGPNVTPEMHRKAQRGEIYSLTTALTVLLAFSIEMGLKTISAKKSGQYLADHNLTALFQFLDQADQDALIAATCRPRAVFDSYLSEMENAFVQWRYLHEYDQLGYQESFAIELLEAIKAMISPPTSVQP